MILSAVTMALITGALAVVSTPISPQLGKSERETSFEQLPAHLHPSIAAHLDIKNHANFLLSSKATANVLSKHNQTAVAVLVNSFGRVAFVEAVRRGIDAVVVLEACLPTDLTPMESTLFFAYARIHFGRRLRRQSVKDRLLAAARSLKLPETVGENKEEGNEAWLWIQEKQAHPIMASTDLLIMAVRNGDPIVLNAFALIPEFDLNEANAEGWTPLTLAASLGNLDVVRTLLTNGAFVNRADGYFPAIDAQDDDLGVTGQLLSPPLTHTIKDGHDAVAQVLLENGANADGIDDLGLGTQSPFERAVGFGRFEMMRVLLAHGTSVYIPRCWPTIRTWSHHRRMIFGILLSSAGYDADVVDLMSHEILTGGSTKLIMKILRLTRSDSAHGQTLLMAAVVAVGRAEYPHGHELSMGWRPFYRPSIAAATRNLNAILATNPNVNARSQSGESALLLAARECSLGVMRRLIASGATVRKLECVVCGLLNR